jgi:hypothetical protein
LPGVDGPAATSGLIEFLFATFFGQKWDVVVLVAFPSCYFHGPTVISRPASERVNADHYRCSALFAELKDISSAWIHRKEWG